MRQEKKYILKKVLIYFQIQKQGLDRYQGEDKVEELSPCRYSEKETQTNNKTKQEHKEMWTSGVKKSINRIGRVWHLNLLKSVSQPASHFFEVDEDLTDHSLSPGCHGKKNLNLGTFYLNYQPNQDTHLISDLFIEKKESAND